MTVQLETVTYEGPAGLLEGVFAYDDTVTTPRPGVLIVHAATGRGPYETERAEVLAGLGYAAFAADLYGQGVQPPSVREGVALARTILSDSAQAAARMNASIEALRRQPAVDSSRIAAIGYCLGGKAVLDLARSGADVAGVVSLHGGLHPPPMPTVSPMKAKVLVLHGWDDPYIPAEQVTALARELTEARADWQIHAYGLTGHSFTNPLGPPRPEGYAYQPDADRRSWKALTDFLAELFP